MRRIRAVSRELSTVLSGGSNVIKKGALVTGVVSALGGLLAVGWPGWVLVLLVLVLIFCVVFTDKGTTNVCRLMLARRGKFTSSQVKGKKR